MFDFFRNLFGRKEETPIKSIPPVIGKLPEERKPQLRAVPRKRISKSSVRASQYYRRNGRYYSASDDSIIDDMMLLLVLDELFADGDIVDMDVVNSAPEFTTDSDGSVDIFVPEADEPEDLLDMDVSSTPVEAAPPVEESKPTPSYSAPEPSYTPEPEPVVKQDSYSSGYSDSSSSYDSGSSDSGSSSYD